MRKSVFLSCIILFIGISVAADAVVVSSSENPVVLDSSNDYSKNLQLDATASTPEGASFNWHRLETSEKFSRPEINYTVGRGGYEDLSLRLVVSSSDSADSELFTRDIKDVPNLSISADTSKINISRNDSVDLYSNATNHFDRFDGKKVRYNWSMQGSMFSSSSETTLKFDENGSYKVKLTVTDAHGLSNSEELSIDVVGSKSAGGGDDDSEDVGGSGDSGGSSSGGSGGGAGGGGSGGAGGGAGPASSGQDSSLSEPGSGVRENVSFTFETEKSVITEIKVPENIGNYSFEVNEKSLDEVNFTNGGFEIYKLVRVKFNSSQKPAKDFKVSYKVDKTWLENKNISYRDVSLYKYNGSNWTNLSTEVSQVNLKDIEFTSYSSGFSYLAIGAQDSVVECIDSNCGSNKSNSSCQSCKEEREPVNNSITLLSILILAALIFLIVITRRRERLKDALKLSENYLARFSFFNNKEKTRELEDQMERIKSKLSHNVKNLDRNKIMHNMNRANTLINEGNLDEAENILDNVEKEIG